MPRTFVKNMEHFESLKPKHANRVIHVGHGDEYVSVGGVTTWE
jgi:hypothetical protein